MKVLSFCVVDRSILLEILFENLDFRMIQQVEI